MSVCGPFTAIGHVHMLLLSNKYVECITFRFSIGKYFQQYDYMRCIYEENIHVCPVAINSAAGNR